MSRDAEAIKALREVLELDKIKNGYRQGIIRKVDLENIDNFGWYVEFTDVNQSTWLDNEASPRYTPKGETAQGFLLPSEELVVYLEQRLPEGNWVIRDYQIESSVLSTAMVLERLGSFISVDEGKIIIHADEIEIQGTLVEVP